MTNQEQIHEALKGAIGEWKPNTGQAEIDFPPDDPLPWPEIDENDFPASPLKADSYDDQTESNEGNISEDGGIIGVAVKKHGIEALAFYKSFRFRDCKPYPGKWGIFYLGQGIELLTHLISIDTSSNLADSRQLAIEFLRSHEKYHFLVDILALGVEPPLSKHLYLPLRHAYRNHGTRCVEEALANAAIWQWAKKKDAEFPGIASFAEGFMSHQPNAYSRFDEPQEILNSELAANLVDQRYGNFTNPNLAVWLNAFPSNISSRFVPEHVIHGRKLSRLFPGVQIFPKIAEVIDTSQVLKKLGRPGSPLKDKWEKTKRKLIACPSLGGLDFKLWPKIPQAWSVRLDRGNRGNLVLKDAALGIWESVCVGTHDECGH